MSSKYQTLKNSWVNNILEHYAPKITMSYLEGIDYIHNGQNVLYADSIIPSGTTQTGFGQAGAVYKGRVRQGYNNGNGSWD